MFWIQTGNHHLFLIAKTSGQKTWVILLGKRKKHFPFVGTQFENATFYDLREKKSYDQTEACLESLKFHLNNPWMIEGKKPFPFRFELYASPLARGKGLLKKLISFDYHLLSASKNPGTIQGERVTSLYGFSEQGAYRLLPGKMGEAPFEYLLLLDPEAESGFLSWRVPKIPFLGDQWGWGKKPPTGNQKNIMILNTYHVPLKNWTLHREIVIADDENAPNSYGLKEYFTPAQRAD